ncbi:hypothetical protein BC827DRAFT_702160 [Russula dissimulans]|nr:hypothetical protein BC827DRAFT_702160 [Russula dissimulans]
MGYHSHRDKRLPDKFICFHCSLRKDKNWEIIKVQPWYEELLGNFSRLALFRRAIKIVEIYAPDSSSAFAKRIASEPIVAAQLFKRLEVEGFIAPKVNADGGIVPPDPRHAKRNARAKVKQQKAVRQKYFFVTASKRGQRYCDYFDPNSAVQLRVMGMEDTVNRASNPLIRTPKMASPNGKAKDTLMGPANTLEPVGGQVQEDPQDTVTGLQSMNNELKRKTKLDTGTDSELTTRKRVKVSVVPAVNLYE